MSAHYEVAEVRYFTELERAALDAAEALDPSTPPIFVANSGSEGGPTAPVMRHGVDCPKAPHTGDGYLHAEGDNRPYDVDGVAYCGRCHTCIDGEQG